MPHSILKICLIAAVVLVATMALTSNYNRHPDEIHHFLAAKYYTNHFFPPEIGDASIRESYSVYGVSYLNYHWAEYLFAGKFAFLLSPFVSDELVAVRFSIVFLFAILVIFFVYKSKESNRELIIPCFLLITPQIWYVFGYVNNDAFALFVSLITAYQIGYEKSIFNKFLDGENFAKHLSGGIYFGFLLGLLLIVKTNYYTFLVFAFLWLTFEKPAVNFSKPFVNYGRLKKYAFLALIASSILGFRCSLDFYVNGETNFVGVSYLNYFRGNFEEKQSRLLAYQEEIAEKPYKPSTIENDLANTDAAMKLKAKGMSFKDIFTKWRWHEISFKSFVGVFGYMNIFAPHFYYQLMFVIYFAFGLFVVVSILLTKRFESIVRLIIFLLSALLTVFISSYLSWTYAFQAQGRYLFPTMAMFGLLVYKNQRYLHNFFVNAFIISAFLLSVYCFLFVGLAQINAEYIAENYFAAFFSKLPTPSSFKIR